ncbi:MAG: hypothetical protein R2755_11340 [Acidimicrobiales bacterium]
MPAPPELVAFHPVSTEVNKAGNQGPQLIEPVDTIDPDRTGDRLV